MAIDEKNIGAFGVSFSRGMDQSWVNMWRKEDGFLVEFFQNFEDMDSDEDDEIISVNEKISIELGQLDHRRGRQRRRRPAASLREPEAAAE